MRSFAACYLSEFKKLKLRKKYIVFTIISALICIMFALIALLIGRTVNQGSASAAISIPMTVMSIFTQFIMPLIIAMAVCDLFASEYRDLSIKAQLMRPVTRFKIYSAKLCAVFVLCAMIFLGIYVVSVLSQIIFIKNSGNVIHSFWAYILNLIPLIPLILMAAFINQFAKGSTSAMFLCIIVYILMKIAGILAPTLDSLLFTGYLEWHKLFLGAMLPPGTLVSKCMLLIGYAITFFSGGYFLFLGREF